MKKFLYLLLGIILVSFFRVNALDDRDYLTYITTQDTVANAGTMTASPYTIELKKGTTFKMLYRAGSDSTVILDNGEYADNVASGTFELKEPFNMNDAHVLNHNYYETTREVSVYSDPSALNTIGVLNEGTKVRVTHYYGPYYYLTNNEIDGWVYVEYLKKIDESDDSNTLIAGKEETTGSPGVASNQPKNKIGVNPVIIAIILLAIIMSVIISVIVVIKKRKINND